MTSPPSRGGLASQSSLRLVDQLQELKSCMPLRDDQVRWPRLLENWHEVGDCLRAVGPHVDFSEDHLTRRWSSLGVSSGGRRSRSWSRPDWLRHRCLQFRRISTR